MKKLLLATTIMLFTAAVYAQVNSAAMEAIKQGPKASVTGVLGAIEAKVSLYDREGKEVKNPIIYDDELYGAFFEGEKLLSPFMGPYAIEEINAELNAVVGRTLKETEFYKQNVKPANGANIIGTTMLKFKPGKIIFDKVEGAQKSGELDGAVQGEMMIRTRGEVIQSGERAVRGFPGKKDDEEIKRAKELLDSLKKENPMKEYKIEDIQQMIRDKNNQP